MKRLWFTLIIILTTLIMGTSCIIDRIPGGSFQVAEPLIGTWQTGFVYVRSDYRYDYAYASRIDIQPDGAMSVTTGYYLKERTSSVWALDYSRTPSTRYFEILSHEYSETEGTVTIYAADNLEVVAMPYYSLDASRMTVILDFNDGTQAVLTRVPDEAV